MSKTKHFNIAIFKNYYAKNGRKTKCEKLETYENVTLNKLQLLVGRFVMGHSEAAVFPKDDYYVYVSDWHCDEEGLVTELAFTAQEAAE